MEMEFRRPPCQVRFQADLQCVDRFPAQRGEISLHESWAGRSHFGVSGLVVFSIFRCQREEVPSDIQSFDPLFMASAVRCDEVEVGKAGPCD
jgi:hypothetical protein